MTPNAIVVKSQEAESKAVDYSEEMQSFTVKFSPAIGRANRDEVYQLLKQFKCRDFLIDVAISNMDHKKIERLYGLDYDGKYVMEEVMEPGDNFGLLAYFPKKENINNLLKNISILQTYEMTQGIQGTSICQVTSGKRKPVYFMMDRKWWSTGFSISFYSFLIKCLSMISEENISAFTDKENFWLDLFKTNEYLSNQTEAKRVKACGHLFKKFYQNLGRLMDKKEEYGFNGMYKEREYGERQYNDIDPYYIHDYSGFCALCSENEMPSFLRSDYRDFLIALQD